MRRLKMRSAVSFEKFHRTSEEVSCFTNARPSMCGDYNRAPLEYFNALIRRFSLSITHHNHYHLRFQDQLDYNYAHDTHGAAHPASRIKPLHISLNSLTTLKLLFNQIKSYNSPPPYKVANTGHALSPTGTIPRANQHQRHGSRLPPVSFDGTCAEANRG